MSFFVKLLHTFGVVNGWSNWSPRWYHMSVQQLAI